MYFICPKCRKELNIASGTGTAICRGGHSFDRAREGYFNLLLGRGGVHGDNAEMVVARRAFLSGGYYAPLAERVSALVAEYAPPSMTVLDAGCGEGYYTSHVIKTLKDDKKKCPIIGFDISREAVRRAAKLCKDAGFAVASSYDIPLADGAVGLVLNTFSPLSLDETRRVVADGGYFIMAIPAEEHLFGLKSAIYDTPYKNTVSDKSLLGFELVYEEELRYTMELSGQNIRDLFMMTPYAYRTPKAGRERIMSLESLKSEAHFLLLVYRKCTQF